MYFVLRTGVFHSEIPSSSHWTHYFRLKDRSSLCKGSFTRSDPYVSTVPNQLVLDSLVGERTGRTSRTTHVGSLFRDWVYEVLSYLDNVWLTYGLYSEVPNLPFSDSTVDGLRRALHCVVDSTSLTVVPKVSRSGVVPLLVVTVVDEVTPEVDVDLKGWLRPLETNEWLAFGLTLRQSLHFLLFLPSLETPVSTKP